MPTNSFLQPVGTVAFGAYVPEDVEQAMDATELRVWEQVDGLLAVPAGERTFDNTVLALAEATDELSTVRMVVNHLAQVIGGPWYAVNERATEREAEVRNRLRFHQGIYRALLELSDRPGYASSLSAPRCKYLKEVVLTYERDGIALDEVRQAELKQVAMELSAAEVAFTRNVSEAHDAAGLLVTDAAELDGLSEEFISSCREAAQKRGLDGWWAQFNGPNFQYLMSNCRVRATRQAFYRVQVTAGRDTNLSLAHDELLLRRRMAQLLGYADYPDYALELRMAKDGRTAAAFIDRLSALYRVAARSEHDELVEFARQFEADPALELDASDVVVEGFYAARLRAGRVGLDEEQLRDYFTLGHVREVLFSTIGALYGLEFRRAQAPAWHDDVEVYQAWDGDRHLSTIWCDWYARPGKVAGAWADVFYTAPRSGGEVKVPSLGCVVCNFPPPGPDGNSRLSIRDVETLWHEFGHAMHMTCNMSELRQQSGFSCRWDFIEAPSQIMENWVWVEEVLSRMAVHYKTAESLPPDVMAKLLACRSFRAATAAMRQFSFAAQDLAMHREYEGNSPEQLLDFYRGVRQRFFPVPIHPEDAYVCSFKHVFGGDEYAAAYYSYKWAEAIEADLFSAFKPDRYLSRDVGMRYREEVLAPGAEREPDELVRAFLGRASTPDAMLERDGIHAPTGD